jgi:hypothetical protein
MQPSPLDESFSALQLDKEYLLHEETNVSVHITVWISVMCNMTQFIIFQYQRDAPWLEMNLSIFISYDSQRLVRNIYGNILYVISIEPFEISGENF